MRKFVWLLVTPLALISQPAEADGQSPQIYAVSQSPLGYRRLPQPLPTPILINCSVNLGWCTFNSISFKVADPDSSQLQGRLKVTDSNGQTVYSTGWTEGFQTGEDNLHSWFWAPHPSTAPGLYRLAVQVTDPDKNRSAWTVSEQILFV